METLASAELILLYGYITEIPYKQKQPLVVPLTVLGRLERSRALLHPFYGRLYSIVFSKWTYLPETAQFLRPTSINYQRPFSKPSNFFLFWTKLYTSPAPNLQYTSSLKWQVHRPIPEARWELRGPVGNNIGKLYRHLLGIAVPLSKSDQFPGKLDSQGFLLRPSPWVLPTMDFPTPSYGSPSAVTGRSIFRLW